jgi:hypothetical protein
MMMVAIMDQYDIYELTDDSSSAKTFIANARGAKRPPAELSRFGGTLKETSVDNEAQEEGRSFLEALYSTQM